MAQRRVIAAHTHTFNPDVPFKRRREKTATEVVYEVHKSGTAPGPENVPYHFVFCRRSYSSCHWFYRSRRYAPPSQLAELFYGAAVFGLSSPDSLLPLPPTVVENARRFRRPRCY